MKKFIIPALILFFVTALTALDIQNDIIRPAQSFLGIPYKTGGVTPSGFDCSGLVYYLYKPYIPELPRISRQMANFGKEIKENQIQPGDLLFFATGSSSRTITHVAIYIGQDSILHSISNGPDRGVTITSLSARYWRNRFYSAARILPEETPRSEKVTNQQFAKGKYTGNVVNGEPDGQGVLVMNNGDRYEGSFDHGVFNGKGTYTHANGKDQTGEFKDGHFTEDSGQEKNYLIEEDSPWETFDGIVEGDFQLWLKAEQEAFKKWKDNN